MMNIHPPKCGVRPGWANIRDAEDLLKLHADRPLRHRHALSAVQSTFDPLGAALWVGAINKFVHRLLILNSPLQTSPSNKYKDILENEYMEQHLVKAVDASLYAKNKLAVPPSWRLPACINRQHIQTELDCIMDGCWGTLGVGAALLYLIQRYQFMGEHRTSIFLFSGTTGLNPMTKPHHQLDSEMMAISLEQKEAQKAIETLKLYMCPLPSALSPAVTLAMGTGLLVH